MNLNKAMLIGRITKDPQLKTTPGGQSVCSFSIATNRTWTDKNGQKQEQSEFHNIVAWGKTAENISAYLTKGCEILVEGRLQTRSWDDKQGNKRYTTEIVAETVQFGAKPQGGAKKATQDEGMPPLEDVNLGEGEVDPADLPF